MKPFLDKTYELILQSSSGAGGSSFSRTLKSFRTVGRLSSPAFKIFDAFNNLGSEDCTETFKKLMVYQTKQNPLRIQRGKGGDITYQTWHSTERLIYDAALICPHPEEGIVVWLQALPIVLEEIFRSGDSLPTDRDEFGNTLLHVRIGLHLFRHGTPDSTATILIMVIGNHLYLALYWQKVANNQSPYSESSPLLV